MYLRSATHPAWAFRKALLWGTLALTACGAPLPRGEAPAATEGPCPTDLSFLRSVQSISVLDTWSALHCGYHLQASLERQSNGSFYGDVILGDTGAAAPEIAHVDGAIVQAWLDELATRPVTTEPEVGGAIRLSWTDDYPRAEVVLRTASGAPRLVYFPDQQREWHLANGPHACRFEAAPADTEGGTFRRHRGIHERFDALRNALGLAAFLEAECGDQSE